MEDRYLLESGAPDGYQLEDGSGVLILEQQPSETKGGTLALMGVGCIAVVVMLFFLVWF